MKNSPKVESFPAHIDQNEIDRRAHEESESVTWSDPQDLPDELPPVMPYSSDLLPPSIGRAVDDIAERMQCPPDYPGCVDVGGDGCGGRMQAWYSPQETR